MSDLSRYHRKKLKTKGRNVGGRRLSWVRSDQACRGVTNRDAIRLKLEHNRERNRKKSIPAWRDLGKKKPAS